MNYEVAQSLWTLSYLALALVPLLVAIPVSQRAGAAKPLLLAGAISLSAAGVFNVAKTIYYWAASYRDYEDGYYTNAFSVFLSYGSLLVVGGGMVLGAVLLVLAVGKLAGPKPTAPMAPSIPQQGAFTYPGAPPAAAQQAPASYPPPQQAPGYGFPPPPAGPGNTVG